MQQNAVESNPYISNLTEILGRVSSPLCVYELGLVCSQTQLCHIGIFNDYIKQLHVLAFSGHLQVVLREQT